MAARPRTPSVGTVRAEHRDRWLGLREVGLFVAAYLVYFGVRAITQGSAPAAVRNAEDIHRLERAAGIAWERPAQLAVLGHDAVVRVANWVYIFGHWPVLLLAGILLFNLRRREYLLLRNVCLISGGLGLVVFALFPVAPPRLAGLGAVDTVTRYASGYRTVLPPSLVNEYAAMPSFHAGWNVLLGIVVYRATANLTLRSLAIVGPAAMVVAVVVTANHYVLDVFAGTAIVVATVLAYDARDRARTRRTLVVDGQRRPGAPGQAAGSAPVHHRPPGGERPAGARARPAAGHQGRRG